MDRVELQAGMGSDEVRAAERRAIFRGQPIHNVEGKIAPPDAEATAPSHAVHFVSVKEAGLMLGIGRSTVYQHVAAGSLHLIKLGRRSVVAIVEIDRLATRLATAAGVDPGLLTGIG